MKKSLIKILPKIQQIFTFLKNPFFKEKDRWILWTPIFFIFGILSYFLWIQTFNYYILGFHFIFYPICFWLLRKSKKLSIILLSLFLINTGYTLTAYRVHRIKSPMVFYKIGYAEVVGKVQKIITYDKKGYFRNKILLEVESIKRNPNFRGHTKPYKNIPYFDKDGVMQNIPKKARIVLLKNQQALEIGDKVKINAQLMSLPKKPFPTGYDFKRYAYFNQIGVIGYNGKITEVSKIDEKKIATRFWNGLNNFRDSAAKRISRKINKLSGGILGALLTGNKGYIKEDVMKNMRTSGLAHLLAISGIHIAIVVGILLFLTRRIFIQSEYFALNFNTKKWAAVCALVGGLAYLLLTGAPTSAKRAYIMACLILIAVVLDKEPYSLRSVAFAAFVLLFFEPEMVLNPGFQMSFSAVVGLISGFKILRQREITLFTTNKFLKPFYYILNTFVASIIAGICIMPFSIYHFNTYSPYGVLANIVAFPLMTFWIMPLSLFSILLYPFGLEKLLLVPASFGADFMIYISKVVASMPNSILIFPSPTKLSMFFIVLGGLWFLIWTKKWRSLGIPLIFAGILIASINPLPDLIIDYQDKIFAITDNEDNLYFSGEPNEYKKELWMKKMGERTFRLITEYPQGIGITKMKKSEKDFPVSYDTFIQKSSGWNKKYKTLECNKNYCLVKIKNEVIYIVKDSESIESACKFGSRVINFSGKYIKECENAEFLYQKGRYKDEDVVVVKL